MEVKIDLTDLGIVVLGLLMFVVTHSAVAGILMACLGVMVRRFILPH
jgi:hypothetical protein